MHDAVFTEITTQSADVFFVLQTWSLRLALHFKNHQPQMFLLLPLGFT